MVFVPTWTDIGFAENVMKEGKISLKSIMYICDFLQYLISFLRTFYDLEIFLILKVLSKRILVQIDLEYWQWALTQWKTGEFSKIKSLSKVFFLLFSWHWWLGKKYCLKLWIQRFLFIFSLWSSHNTFCIRYWIVQQLIINISTLYWLQNIIY